MHIGTWASSCLTLPISHRKNYRLCGKTPWSGPLIYSLHTKAGRKVNPFHSWTFCSTLSVVNRSIVASHYQSRSWPSTSIPQALCDRHRAPAATSWNASVDGDENVLEKPICLLSPDISWLSLLQEKSLILEAYLPSSGSSPPAIPRASSGPEYVRQQHHQPPTLAALPHHYLWWRRQRQKQRQWRRQ